MSRDIYGPGSTLGSGMGTRSPRNTMRIGELPTVDRSPSRNYPGSTSRHSPNRRRLRGGTSSPDHYGNYYGREEDLGSPILIEERGRPISSGGSMHRSRSATRAMPERGGLITRYQSLDRGGGGGGILSDHDREFIPIREPRDRSLDHAIRDRTMDRNLYLDDDEIYGGMPIHRSVRQSPTSHLYMGSHHIRDTGPGGGGGGGYLGELQHQNTDLHKELTNLKRELELTSQKLNSSMHSIKTFWSPELKKERALRKEESAKYSLINDQLKLLHAENQVIHIKLLDFFF